MTSLGRSVFGTSFAFLLLAASCTETTERPGAAGESDAGPGGGGDADGGVQGAEGGGGGAGDGATEVPVVTITNETLTSSGEQRSYTLVVPKTYDASKAYPLVLVLHGDGGDGPSYHSFFTYEKASGQDAILAYPSGTNKLWDIYTPLAQNKDMQFVRDLKTALLATYNIDAARVFGDGYSSGGFFVDQLACRVNGFFTGITMHAGGAPDEQGAARYAENDCVNCAQNGGGPVATLVLHGQADGAVAVGSGEYAANCAATNNGCTTRYPYGELTSCQAATGCQPGKPVELCVVPGLGHVPWSEGAARSWAFFKALP